MDDKLTVNDFLTKFERLCNDTNAIKQAIAEREGNTEAKDRLMVLEEAALYLSLAKSTLYRLVSERKIPFHRFPGTKRLYFLDSELQKVLQNR